MIHSLQFRLLLAFTIVIVVAIGAVSLFVAQSTAGEIRQYQQRSEEMHWHRTEGVLAGYYFRQGGWDGIQPFVEEMAKLSGRRIVLADSGGVASAAR